MLRVLLALKKIGLVCLLLGFSCSFTPWLQSSPGCRNSTDRDTDKAFILFPDKILQKSPDSDTRLKRELFKEAYAGFQQGNFPLARLRWLEILDNYPELKDYIYHYLAQTEAALGQPAAAINYWRELISQFPHSRLIPEATLGLADNYFMQGEFDQAAPLYRQLLAKNWGDKQLRPVIYQMLARCYEQQADFPRAIAAYHKLWLKHPASSQANIALQSKLLLSQEHDIPYTAPTEQERWQRIKILIREAEYAAASSALEQFRQQFSTSYMLPDSYLKQARCDMGLQKPAAAIEHLKKLIRLFPRHKKATEARYKLARLYWNRGQDRLAQDYLNQIIRDYSGWQDNAWYILARIHEENKQYPKAIQSYQALIAKFPLSSLVNVARWRLGWIYYYYLKQYAPAAKFFAEVNNDGDLYYSAQYWQGRCQEELKAWQPAIELYTSLIAAVNHTYYAQLAERRLQNLKSNGAEDRLSLPLSASPKTLSLTTDPFLIGRLLSEADKFHLQRVREFAALLMFETAIEELDEISNPAKPPPEFWYQLSQLYHLLGNYSKPIRLIQRVVDHAREKRLTIPPAVWKICYPLNYWTLIKNQAEARGINPYLIMGLIRQESVFDPESFSEANAMGLMQVIPATGQAMAQKLQLTEFTPDMLYQPETNLALGTYYVNQLLRKYKGNLALTLAAYNAGEKAANKWWKKYKSDDMATFIENIPYPETRNYVKQVQSNYYNYRRIYLDQRT